MIVLLLYVSCNCVSATWLTCAHVADGRTTLELVATALKCQKPAVCDLQPAKDFAAACSGVSIRKHCVCAYAHKNRRLCDSAYPDDPHKSVYSSKTEHAIELKLSRTM